jgi:hypothetical protein
MWNFFRKKNKHREVIDNGITFTIHDGKPWVSLDIAELDDQSIKDFAELLFSINTGKYQHTIVKILVSLCGDKPELLEQFEAILKYWLILDDNYQKESRNKALKEPMISPRNVFLGTEK